MKPGRYDPPIIYRGCNWPAITITWKGVDGNPINLTGWMPYAQTRNGINLNPTIVDPLAGITELALFNTQTADLPLGRAQWDWIWLYVSAQQALPPSLYGFVEVRDPVTNDFPRPPDIRSNGTHAVLQRK